MPCPMDRDWHKRSQTQPTGREAEGFTPVVAEGRGRRVQGGDPDRQESPE